MDKRSQVERLTIAEGLLESVWVDILKGKREDGVLQVGVYCQTFINRIMWKLNDENNRKEESK